MDEWISFWRKRSVFGGFDQILEEWISYWRKFWEHWMCVPVGMKIIGEITYNLMKGKISLANKLV